MKKYPFQDLPEGLANIEVEKGETLITPDGRTYSFPTGRKHSKGGIKILAEPGSWVASAYQKFDRSVAKKLMPLEKLNAKKGKKIPVADISKKYDTTNYFEMLENKDGRLDELRASTSQYMIAKYSAHQGNILKAQEEMKRDKGLDHDLDELDDNPNQGMMTAKMGGKLNSRKYKSGGVAPGTRNGQTKKSWRKGKKMAVWMDGSWHHFGDSSMQDFRTHKSDKRKKAYYDRHKKNLQGDSSRAKAFRAYSRKTWQNGGEIDTIPEPIILPVENYDNRATPYLENWERYAPELPDNVYERRFARPRPSQEYIDSLQNLPKQRTIIDLRPMAPPKPVIRVPMPDTTRVPEPLMRGGGYMDMYQNGGYRDRDTIVPPNVMPMDTFPPKPFYDDSYKEFAPERPPMPPNPRMQPKLQNDEDFRNYRDNLLRFLNDSTRNQTPTVIPSSPIVPSVPSVPGPMPLKYGGEIPKYQNAGKIPYYLYNNLLREGLNPDMLDMSSPYYMDDEYLTLRYQDGSIRDYPLSYLDSSALTFVPRKTGFIHDYSKGYSPDTPADLNTSNPAVLDMYKKYLDKYMPDRLKKDVSTLLSPSMIRISPPDVGSTGTPSGVSSTSSTSSASSVPSSTGLGTTGPNKLSEDAAIRRGVGLNDPPTGPFNPLRTQFPEESRLYDPLYELPHNVDWAKNKKDFWGWGITSPAPANIQSSTTSGLHGTVQQITPGQLATYLWHNKGVKPEDVTTDDIMRHFQGAHKERYGHYIDTDESAGVQNILQHGQDKYGSFNAGIPGFATTMLGEKEGLITLEEYSKDPDKIAAEYGMSKTKLDNIFKADEFKNALSAIEIIPYPKIEKKPIPSLRPDIPTIRPDIPDPTKPPVKKDKPKKEVPVGTDPEKLLYNLKQGLLAAQLAGLERDLPYYAYSPIKAVVNRFDPVNTKAAERMFNMSSEALRNSNLPEAVKQARLSDMGANLAKSVAQTGMQNYQGSLQNRNLVAQRIRDVLNRNIQAREQANKQYFMEDAQGKFLTQQTRQNLMENMFENVNARLAALRGRELISKLGDNFAIDPAGNLVFLKGKGVKPQYDQLDVFGGDMSWINDIPYGELRALRKKHSKGETE